MFDPLLLPYLQASTWIDLDHLAGLCYQRLSVGDGGAPYCLHGLNAVYLPERGWYRIDARGNKPGVQAAFTPPHEQLAFAMVDSNEGDLPGIWAAPLGTVVQALTTYTDVFELSRALPDVHPGQFDLTQSAPGSSWCPPAAPAPWPQPRR